MAHATFNTSLMREKFVIRDVTATDSAAAEPIIALSNRLAVPLSSPAGRTEEHFIVRAQNMHICARFAARMAQDFSDHGPIMDRKDPFDWEYIWLSITKGYEKTWNPQKWLAVYHKGRVVYEAGDVERHAFLDIIEQCDAVNPDSYDKSLKIAEDAFRKAGKFVTIEYDSNIALVMSVTKDEGKSGVIVRGPARTTTFNLTAKPRGGRDVKPSQCLSAAAAFLEGIQLAFLVGMTNIKLQYELIDKLSDDGRKGRDASQKIGRLNSAIAQFENLLEVSYRPDRPDFGRMIDDAEVFARKVLAAEIERKIESGEIDGSQWVT